ncbi:hypothetical protein FVE85_4995 [Porphyridium purpureum]|uniref:Uncharacterized protein n=1 Tax=Porphyridium purpureum TaxID=35688 RepID=A0A5J4YRF1_PORPP|nr:hypothetical protein FVE85_4995 [Porphyridium purpureum]|eukprot:POR8704..scf236_6
MRRSHAVADALGLDLCRGLYFPDHSMKSMHYVVVTHVRIKSGKDMAMAMNKQIRFLRAHRVDVTTGKSDPGSGWIAMVGDLEEKGILVSFTAAAEAVPAAKRGDSDCEGDNARDYERAAIIIALRTHSSVD